jgi:hypothetical protein
MGFTSFFNSLLSGNTKTNKTRKHRRKHFKQNKMTHCHHRKCRHTCRNPNTCKHRHHKTYHNRYKMKGGWGEIPPTI